MHLLQEEQVWKATLSFARYEHSTTKEVDLPAYTVMTPRADILERTVHISDEQLERVLDNLMTKLRTTTTVTKVEHHLGYSIDNYLDPQQPCTSTPFESARNQTPTTSDIDASYDSIEKDLRCYLCGQT